MTVKEKEYLIIVLRRWASCFAVNDKHPGLTNLGEIEISLTTNIPIDHRPYRLSYAENAIVRAKAGEARLCVDYRALNVVTVKDRYPLPLIWNQLH